MGGIAALCFLGCGGHRLTGVYPDWAMHIKTPSVEHDDSADRVAGKLEKELASFDLEGTPRDLVGAALAASFSRSEVLPELWKLAGYHDERYYPVDAAVRQYALSAIVRITIRDITKKQVGPKARVATTGSASAF